MTHDNVTLIHSSSNTFLQIKNFKLFRDSMYNGGQQIDDINTDGTYKPSSTNTSLNTYNVVVKTPNGWVAAESSSPLYHSAPLTTVDFINGETLSGSAFDPTEVYPNNPFQPGDLVYYNTPSNTSIRAVVTRVNHDNTYNLHGISTSETILPITPHPAIHITSVSHFALRPLHYYTVDQPVLVFNTSSKIWGFAVVSTVISPPFPIVPVDIPAADITSSTNTPPQMFEVVQINYNSQTHFAVTLDQPQPGNRRVHIVINAPISYTVTSTQTFSEHDIQPITLEPDDLRFISFDPAGVQQTLMFSQAAKPSNNLANDASASHSFYHIVKLVNNDGLTHNIMHGDGSVTTDKYTHQIFTQDLSRYGGIWAVDETAIWYEVSRPDSRHIPNGHYSVENIEDNQVGGKIFLKKLDPPYMNSHHTILNVKVPFDDTLTITLATQSITIGPFDLSHLGQLNDRSDKRSQSPRPYHHTSCRPRYRRGSGRHDQQLLYSDPFQQHAVYPAQWKQWLQSSFVDGITPDTVPNPNRPHHHPINRCVTHGRSRQKTRNPFIQSPMNLEVFRLKFALDCISNEPSGQITFDNQWVLNLESSNNKPYNIEVYFNIIDTLVIAPGGQLKYVPATID